MSHQSAPRGSSAASPHPASADGQSWRLDEFVERVPGVVHAVLASADGLVLNVASGTDRDAADSYAASISGIESICAQMPGPSGAQQSPRQVLIECDDHLFMIMATGEMDRSALRPETGQGMVHGVLLVVTEVLADAQIVGDAMRKLILAFSEHMGAPARQPEALAAEGSSPAAAR